MSDRLTSFARRVADHPLFLAPVLAEYARSEGLDDAALAAALGCRVEDLDGLRCCGVPRPEPLFRDDVRALAGRFGLNAAALARAVRQGQALRHLRGRPVADGTLLAARDAPPEEPPP